MRKKLLLGKEIIGMAMFLTALVFCNNSIAQCNSIIITKSSRSKFLTNDGVIGELHHFNNSSQELRPQKDRAYPDRLGESRQTLFFSFLNDTGTGKVTMTSTKNRLKTDKSFAITRLPETGSYKHRALADQMFHIEYTRKKGYPPMYERTKHLLPIFRASIISTARKGHFFYRFLQNFYGNFIS